jgi:hypothetical protein
MTPERLEELLRTRPSDQRTYNRQLPDLAMRRAPVRAGGLPLGWAAAVLVVGLVAVVGASTFGPWQHGHSGAKPSVAAGTFTSTGSLNEARAQGSATLLKDGRVLVVGVSDATDLATAPSAQLYDPATGKFTLTGSPHLGGLVPIVSAPRPSCMTRRPAPSARPARWPAPLATGSTTATLLSDGRVLIAGGYGRLNGVLASAELYDPKTGTFSPTGSMTTARWRVTHRHAALRRPRPDRRGGSNEHTVARGPFGFGSAAYTSRYPAIWRIAIGATALWTSSWRETREATAA